MNSASIRHKPEDWFTSENAGRPGISANASTPGRDRQGAACFHTGNETAGSCHPGGWRNPKARGTPPQPHHIGPPALETIVNFKLIPALAPPARPALPRPRPCHFSVNFGFVRRIPQATPRVPDWGALQESVGHGAAIRTSCIRKGCMPATRTGAVEPAVPGPVLLYVYRRRSGVGESGEAGAGGVGSGRSGHG